MQLHIGHVSFTGTDRHKYHTSFTEGVHGSIAYVPESHTSFTGTVKHKGHASLTETDRYRAYATFNGTERPGGYTNMLSSVDHVLISFYYLLPI